MTGGAHFEIFESQEADPASDRWRWRLRAANGRILASGQAYRDERDVRRALEDLGQGFLYAAGLDPQMPLALSIRVVEA